MSENSIQTMRGTMASTMRWPNVNRGLVSVVTQMILAELAAVERGVVRVIGSRRETFSRPNPAVAQPAEQFRQRSAFAVHEDADAIKARGKPERGHNAEPP